MESLKKDSGEYVESSASDDDRPNRWHGPPSTWQQMNIEEIDTITALNEIRNQDLSVHLYNAFALKQRHKTPLNDNLPIPNQDINAATGQTVQEDDWIPQRSWTAWPMVADKVPAPDFMRRTDEADVAYTTKKTTLELPSTALQEAISATILRIAKEKFESRPWEDDDEIDDASLDGEANDALSNKSDGSGSQSDRPGARSRSISRPLKRESDTEGESAGEQPKPDSSEDKGERPRQRYLRPTVATDDDLSYALLRPSVRHILSQLDETLNVLHIFQDSTMDYVSDSGDSDASGSSHFSRPSSREGPQSGAKGKRGRPRKDGTPSASRRSEPLSGTDDHQGKTNQSFISRSSEQLSGRGDKKSRRGRPKKIYERLQDESEKEYSIRIARLQKKSIPAFLDVDSGAEASKESEVETVTKGPRSRSRSKSRSKRKAIKEPSPERSKTKKIPKDGWNIRVKPRDWKNVLGAAALAGFPPQAIDRAARRCADLFGQNMEFHTLVEGPVGQHDAVRTTRYVPGMPRPPILESENEEPPPKSRYGTGGSSTAADATPTGEGGSSYGRSGSASYNNSMRNRSRSASATGSHFCTYGDCPRATEGFSRRQNLLRHMKLVHGFEGDSIPVEVDSEDEMYGGVHVDGFLKPIKIRPGWRSTDIGEEPRKRKRGRVRRGSMSGTDGGSHTLDSADGEPEESRDSEEW